MNEQIEMLKLVGIFLVVVYFREWYKWQSPVKVFHL